MSLVAVLYRHYHLHHSADFHQPLIAVSLWAVDHYALWSPRHVDVGSDARKPDTVLVHRLPLVRRLKIWETKQKCPLPRPL